MQTATNYFISNVRGITLTQCIFTPLVFILPWFLDFDYSWWILSIFVYYCTGCLGITITYHRYLTHKSFSMPKWCEYLFTFFGAMGGTGSSIGWIAVHKEHHRFSDKSGDPHSPKLLGWKIFSSSYEYKFNPINVRKFLKDKFHLLLHRYYYLIFISWGLLLALIDFNLCFFGFIVPVTIQIWASNISNWGNHSYGYRNFKINDNSKNTWWVSALTWGEGWHNNHHARPGNYTFQYKWYEFDISAYTIYLICLIFGTKKSMRLAGR